MWTFQVVHVLQNDVLNPPHLFAFVLYAILNVSCSLMCSWFSLSTVCSNLLSKCVHPLVVPLSFMTPLIYYLHNNKKEKIYIYLPFEMHIKHQFRRHVPSVRLSHIQSHTQFIRTNKQTQTKKLSVVSHGSSDCLHNATKNCSPDRPRRWNQLNLSWTRSRTSSD